MKKLLVLAAMLMLMAVGMPRAFASSPWTTHHWGNGGAIGYKLSDSTGWAQFKIDAVIDADTAWQITDAPTLSLLSQTSFADWTGCGDLTHPSIVERVGPGALGGKDGLTTLCYDGSGNIVKFWLEYVEYPAGNGASYYGPDIPEPANTTGERGVIAHEFGHALGFGSCSNPLSHWQTTFSGCPAPSTYCQNQDQGGAQGAWQTMCAGAWKASSGQFYYNPDLTLGQHDQDVMNNTY